MTSTLIQTPFGEGSTAAEVIEGVDLSGKQAVVTGAASGPGAETARALASAGASVTLAVRSTDAGELTATGTRKAAGNDAVHVGPLDLADRALTAVRPDRPSERHDTPPGQGRSTHTDRRHEQRIHPVRE